MNELAQKLKALFEGVEISEDTLVKLKLLVEAAVLERVEAETTPLKAEMETIKESAQAEKDKLMEQAEEYGEYLTEELTAKSEEYAKYVVEKFVEEHQAELVDGAEVVKMKAIFEDVKSAFEKALLPLNFDKTAEEQVAELNAKIEEQKTSYTELFEQFVDVKKLLEQQQYAEIFESVTSKLADTQKEKINTLLEHISFSDTAQFKKAVEILVEEVLSTPKADVAPPTEELNPEQKAVNDKMSSYLKQL